MKIEIEHSDIGKIIDGATDKATRKIFTEIEKRVSELDLDAIAEEHLRKSVTVRAEVTKKCFDIATQQISEIDLDTMVFEVLTHIVSSRLTRLNNSLLEQLLANQRSADSLYERVAQAAADAEEIIEKLKAASGGGGA